MKKLLLLILFASFSFTCLFSQSKYCLTHSDFINNNWIQEDSLAITPVEGSGCYIASISNSKFTKKQNKGFNKILKKKALYIVYDSVLYVNRRNIVSKGSSLGYNYSYGFRFKDNEVCIISHKVSVGIIFKASALSSLAMQVVPPIASGIIYQSVYSAVLDNNVCYVISSDSKKVKLVDAKYMTEIIKEHKPELLDKYNSIKKKKDKEAAATVLEYLKEMQIISKY